MSRAVREAGVQIGLQVLNGDEHRSLGAHARRTRVVHVRVRVDEARQHGRLAEIDHRHAGRNPHLTFGADLRDALAGDEHDLLRQHAAADAVEQTAGANRDRTRRPADTARSCPRDSRRVPCR